nr:hypothetical protein [uncultured Jannaschia sp.]
MAAQQRFEACGHSRQVAQDQPVRPGVEIGDHVVADPAREDEAIPAGPAAKLVVATPAEQAIAARAAVQRVVAPAALKTVAAPAAGQTVPAGSAMQDVVADPVAENVVARSAAQRVVARSAGQRVGGEPPSGKGARIVRPAGRRLRHGSQTAGCRRCPRAQQTSTCCSSPSPSPGWSGATAFV